MKTFTASLFTVLLSTALAGAEDAPKRPAAPIKFRVQQLQVDNNEGCAIADFNKDGKPDVVAGRNWFPAPGFDKPHPVRKIADWGKDYVESNGDHAFDVDGDGWVDVIAGDFKGTAVNWYKNPGAAKHGEGKLWEQHLLGETGLGSNEMTFLHDMDGDGHPEWVANSWSDKNPMVVWKFGKDGSGKVFEKKTVSESSPVSNGHGMGFGDINGDGHEDIVYKNGWYQRPAENPFAQPWKRHTDFTLPHASCPILIEDMDGDGRADLIWGNGHGYGLYFDRQLPPDPDGTTNWERKVIDETFSQAHALAWADLDGDGKNELVTGKRVRAHSGNDPGAKEVPGIYYYKWDPASAKFSGFLVAEGEVGIGLQIRIADLDGNGKPDIVCAGKSGTHIVFNEG